MSYLSDPGFRDALERIVRHEEEKEQRYKTDPAFAGLNTAPYWELMDVPVEWKHVRQLMFLGLVEKLGKRFYILKDRGLVKKDLEVYGKEAAARGTQAEALTQQGFPSDLFDVVEGYDDLKEFIKLTLTAEEPVHCLLYGPPGTAKSIILMDLEQIGARFITAGTATKVGIRDIIFDELPRILIVDEIDKVDDSKDLASLLTWMESGRIIITMHGRREERRGKGWVFAACNRVDRLPPELLDRFQVFHIKPYTKEQFIRVVTGFLTKRMSVDESLANHIASKVQEYSVSVREAVRIARLADNKDDVDKIVGIIRKYGGDR